MVANLQGFWFSSQSGGRCATSRVVSVVGEGGWYTGEIASIMRFWSIMVLHWLSIEVVLAGLLGVSSLFHCQASGGILPSWKHLVDTIQCDSACLEPDKLFSMARPSLRHVGNQGSWQNISEFGSRTV